MSLTSTSFPRALLPSDIVALICLVAIVCSYVFQRRSYYRLPPGPKPLPIVGNLFAVPKKFAWKQYSTWASHYGDVISLTVFGQVIVVFNSVSAIKQGALQQPGLFSSRASVKFLEMTGMQDTFTAFLPYGQRWRERRRILDQEFRLQSVRKHFSKLQERAVIVMQRLRQDPKHWLDHTQEYTAGIIMSIVYGYDIKQTDDHFVTVIEEVNHLSTRYALPGALIVNTFPFLGRLPTWALGPTFAKLLEDATTKHQSMMHDPYEWVRERMQSGTAKPSLVSEFLERANHEDKGKELIHQEALGMAFIAASDTTVSTLTNFILAMVLYPDVQAKARDEVDRTIGRNRLPLLEDRPSMPYIEALILELWRWNPVAPQGLPHRTTDDVFLKDKDFYIPKGATVIFNAWAILHDPESFPDPDRFNPSRFLSADGQLVNDPAIDYAFGFGNRKCPGRALADVSTWLFVVSLLTSFDISPAKDELGREIPVDVDVTTQGIIIHPLPFECCIRPRNEDAIQFIDASIIAQE